MASFFLHMEDASEEGRVAGELPAGGLDESETATAEIADLRAEEAEVVEAEREADDLDDRVELAEDVAEEVEPVVTEGKGLDKAGMAIALAALRRIAGKQAKHLVGKNIRMEAIDAGASGRAEQTKIVFEDLKDTLKSAWAAIKAAFKKAWAKIKTWYIKTFDASKKLKKRAENIRTKAENTSATIDKKTFSFSGAKSIYTGAKLQPGELNTALAAAKNLADKYLDTVKSDDVGNKATELGTLLGEVGKDEAAINSAISAIYEKVINVQDPANLNSDNVVESKVKDSFGANNEVNVKTSVELPGARAVAYVKGTAGKNADINSKIAAVRRTRLTMTNTKDKPKEITGDVTTASTSQVSTLCDHVIEIAELIFDFKKGWENRDRDQEKLIKAIDDAFKDVSSEKDENVTSPIRRHARGLASAATGLLRRDSAFKASFVGYLMTTCNVALSYAEGSLRQHKK